MTSQWETSLQSNAVSHWLGTILESALLHDPCWCYWLLTHWGRVTHICVGKPAIIGSDNGLSPDRRQAIIWTNAGILLIGPLGTHFSENFNWNSNIFILENALENVVCKMVLILSRPQCVKVFVPRRLSCKFWLSHLQAHVNDIYFEYFLWNLPHRNATWTQWR